MARRSVPGLFIDVDMTELEYATEVIKEFTQSLSTTAHLRAVTDTTHKVFSKRFDQHMSRMARFDKERFHHVYEYSPTGDGYSWVGFQKYQLWTHRKRFTSGAPVNFSWDWKPAKQYNPDYHQRRRAKVGHDALRDIDQETFNTLVEKSSGKRHIFVWKAPMLEYGIVPTVYPRNGRVLAVPVHKTANFDNEAEKANGPRLLFLTRAQPFHQAPSRTTGNFTFEWTHFWQNIVPGQVDEVMGAAIARSAEKNLAAAIRKKKKAKPYKREFSFTAVTDYREARLAGAQQALAAIRLHTNSIKQIEMKTGDFYNIGLN